MLLIRLNSQMNGENIAKLLPAFQCAYQLLMMDWRSTQGLLDHMLANFFVDYGQHLAARFPTESVELQQLHQDFIRQDREETARWTWQSYRIEPLNQWRTHHRDPIYRPFRQLLLEALEALKQEHPLPLLSTPTHTPYWIDPVVLVERLCAYQQHRVTPASADWQLAISRTALDDTAAARQSAQAKLSGEYQALMLFLLDPEGRPPATCAHPEVWMTAALTKQPTSAQTAYEQWAWPKLPASYTCKEPHWQFVAEDTYQDYYDYRQRKYLKEKYVRKTLKFGSPPVGQLRRLVNGLLPGRKETALIIHQNIDLKAPFLLAEHNDVARYLSLVPNHPEPLIALVIRRTLANDQHDTHRALLTATLQALLNWSGSFDPLSHLLIATSMLGSDKTVRALAAELWIRGVEEGTLDSERIGRIIGEQARVGFAPLKRFTDLLTEQMLRISARHNQELAKLLSASVALLPEKPIRGQKKLLEIYREVMPPQEPASELRQVAVAS